MLTDLTIDLSTLTATPLKAYQPRLTSTRRPNPAEPYSWGQSRGMETEVRAELFDVQIGGLKLSRDMLVQMLSEAEVSSIEDSIAEAHVVEEAA